ncbi:MAG: AEC family transporter, partial [Lachnospiraceae bacterium]|nr:AEC family transporter [Lachnospiraceae bacterium]
ANVLFAVNVFNNLYKKGFEGIFSLLSLYVALGTVVILLFLLWFIPRIEKDPARQGSLIHTGFRGNAMLYALPIAQAVFKDSVPEITIALALVVLVNNVCSVPLMEHYRNRVHRGKDGSEEKASFGSLVLGVLKTPIFLAVVLGVLWSFLKLPMPALCAEVITDLSATVVPLAFLALGASMSLSHLHSNSRNVMIVVFLRLILFPAVFLIWPILAGWNERAVVAVMVTFACPSALMAYSMSDAYDCDGTLAGEVVSISSFIAIFTLFLWIFCFKQFGVIS